jgi:hypothetical protein
MKPIGESCPSSTFKHGFVHSVYFWLKPDLTEQQIEEFESALRLMIEDSQYALTGHIGKPAGTPRKVVDNTYDFNLIVTFDDAASHDSYQTEAPHDRFREISSQYTERVQIYDSMA